MKELRDDRVHARMALVRDLFGLNVADEALLEEPAPELRRGPRADAPQPAALLMRIGTRGSALALAQARSVAVLLDDGAEIVEITTSGDRGAAVNDKSRWVSELERALLEGRIDLAVHSAKDVPAELPDGLELVAIPARADARDAICGAGSLAELAPGSTGRHQQPAADGADQRACATTSRSWNYAAMSTPGCASSPTARSTRSCWRSQACSASAASTKPAAS